MSFETLKTKVGLLIEKAQSGGNTDELEAIIDNSGVLDSTEGTVEEKVEQLVDKAVWEKVWYEASSKLKNAEGLFRGYQGITIPRTNLILTTTLGNFLGNTSDSDPDSFSKVEYIDYYIDSKNATSANYAFRFCYNLKWLIGVNTSKMTNILGMFFKCTSLETIQEAFDFSKATNTSNVFNGCEALKDIKFVPETIKISITIPSAVLSDESIQSIIDGLATVETAQTLTLHADVKAKLTQTQLDTITGKNWNLA